jgi:hypothetical protein
MNDDATDINQTEEEILSHDVADEALEAAAGPVQGGLKASWGPHTATACGWQC